MRAPVVEDYGDGYMAFCPGCGKCLGWEAEHVKTCPECGSIITYMGDDTLTEKSCYSCRFFAELKKPYEISDGAQIFGYCFGGRNKSYNMGKGLPVFIPDSCCKDHKKAKTCSRSV